MFNKKYIVEMDKSLGNMPKKTLRPIQIEKSNQCYSILSEFGLVYLAGQVRSGKTSTSLDVARQFGASRVLFLTKKKAIDGILDDYIDFGFDSFFEITVINDESIHKVEGDFGLVIHDEHHRFGAFPKLGKAGKIYKDKYYMKPQIFLSGTPTPENYTQLYHQMQVSYYSPWRKYSSFYKWAKDGYVNISQKRIGTHMVNDYTGGVKSKILSDVKHLFVKMTQAESGFKSKVIENFLYVDMMPRTYKMIDQIMKNKFIEGKDELVLGDTPAKLRQKVHQLCSGTIKFESGNSMILDYSKIDFIKERFKGNKLAIFYKFKAEFDMIKERMDVTQDIDEFNNSDKNIALQFVSGREGTNLSKADYLININIDDSATTYWQARDRMTIASREENNIFWIFSSGDTIESKIYKSVKGKKSYTNTIFKKDFGIKG